MELAQANLIKQGNNYRVAHGDDSALIVEFYKEAVRNNFKSEQAGHEVFEDQDFVWIRFAGDRTRELRKPVKNEHKERWPQQWARYQNQEKQVNEGMPLEHWGAMSKSTALNYKANNVFTVEQMAAIPDSVIDKLGIGTRDFRNKAQLFLKQSAGSAESMRLADENKKLRDEIELLKAQFAEFSNSKQKKEK
jgi:hypothetical protein